MVYQVLSYSDTSDFYSHKALWECSKASSGWPRTGPTRDQAGGCNRWPHTNTQALAHLEFLMDALLQDFGSLAVLHLHLPLLCQDPGFLIGQSIPELFGDLCLLLFPFKRTADIRRRGKRRDHMPTEFQIKAMPSHSWSIRMASVWGSLMLAKVGKKNHSSPVQEWKSAELLWKPGKKKKKKSRESHFLLEFTKV